MGLVLVLAGWTAVAVARGGEGAAPTAAAAAASGPATKVAEPIAEMRRKFQAQEVVPGRAFGWVFNVGDEPRLIWRDVDEVRRVTGGDGVLRVRWFDGDLVERERPDKAGRWGAYLEGRGPGGTVVRRGVTLYARPEGFFVYLPKGATRPAYLAGPIAEEVWREHGEEVGAVWNDALLRGLNDSVGAARLLAHLSGVKAAGREVRQSETVAARDEAFHLGIKQKVMGVGGKALAGPRRIGGEDGKGRAAPVLRAGSEAEAGFVEGTAAEIDRVCREWAAASGEPFVTVVARNGVAIVHGAYGEGEDGRAVGKGYRCDVASITKTVTATVFARFVDQGLLGLDDSVAVAFADWPKDDRRVPTFRQCLTHMSGLSGHGDFGGVTNPYFENVVLNGIDVNEPGKAYVYSGAGFDLTAKAMETVTGRPWRELYREALFEPVGMGDVPLANASAGAKFTAWELGTLGQVWLNRGKYGEVELFSERTFERLLAEDLSKRYPGVNEVEGIGNHPMRPGGGGIKGFSERVIGHGALTQCMFFVDLETGVVMTQVRRQGGEGFGEWSRKFLEAIGRGVK